MKHHIMSNHMREMMSMQQYACWCSGAASGSSFFFFKCKWPENSFFLPLLHWSRSVPLSVSAYHDCSWVVVALKHTYYSNQHYVGHIEVHRFQLITSFLYNQSGFSYQFSSLLIERETNYLKALKKKSPVQKEISWWWVICLLGLTVQWKSSVSLWRQLLWRRSGKSWVFYNSPQWPNLF